jgi:septal ring factor EnvC (AmiA/AmiB activator)
MSSIWANQVARTKDAIDNARQRLSGGFQKDQEYRDLRASLDRLITDRPILENKLRDAEITLAQSKQFLDQLPADLMLQPVKGVAQNGYDLPTVQRRIANAEDEIKQLRSVPTPSADIEQHVREYVAALARPTISGIATGATLRVSWPDDMIAVLALLLPDEMVDALMQEIERQANTPMPLLERKKRIAQLTAEIDALQRQALTLGAETSDLPPHIVLGVRVVTVKKERVA